MILPAVQYLTGTEAVQNKNDAAPKHCLKEKV
jgi:hypothetical protein